MPTSVLAQILGREIFSFFETRLDRVSLTSLLVIAFAVRSSVVKETAGLAQCLAVQSCWFTVLWMCGGE